MVKVLMPQRRPLQRSHSPEEAVRLRRTLLRTSRRKALNPIQQPLPLRGIILLAQHDQALLCGHIPADRPVSQNRPLRHLSHNPPDEASRWSLHTRSLFHLCGAVCKHLPGAHHTPLPLSVRPQLLHPRFHLYRGRAKAIYEPPTGDFGSRPPLETITTYWRPSTMYVAGVAIPE